MGRDVSYKMGKNFWNLQNDKGLRDALIGLAGVIVGTLLSGGLNYWS